jgi:protocatechuate 3,4-dioxygenase beta subunit
MKRNFFILMIIVFALSACKGLEAKPVTPAGSSQTIIETPVAATAASQPANEDKAAVDNNSSPDCTSPAALSPAMTEGPYYKPDTPERKSLVEPGMPGTKLTLTGYVLDTNCQPVANAWMDFWQADASGAYDNQGYTLRGHQFTDENGRYQLDTVVPGLYPGRTEHIHVKIQAPDGPVLTTQLFFPNVANNESDQIYSPELLIKITKESGDTMQGEFNFVIKGQ